MADEVADARPVPTPALRSGALPLPDDDPPRPEPTDAERFGWRMQPSEHDVEAGRYDIPPLSEWAGPEERSAHARASHLTGSPHIIRFGSCHGCGVHLCFYGREDRFVEPMECGKCRAESTTT